MLTKQENYRDPEVMAYARLAQRLALVPGTCEEVDEKHGRLIGEIRSGKTITTQRAVSS